MEANILPAFLRLQELVSLCLEIMENLENQEKSSMHGKIMEFEKT